MTFRKQLLLGIGAVTTVMMFCAVMSLATLWASRTETAEVTAELLDQLETTQRVGVLSERLIASARGYLLTGDARERAVVVEVANELSSALAAMTRATRSAVRMSKLVAVRLAGDQYVREVFRSDEGRLARDVRVARSALNRAVRSLLESENRRAEALTRRSGDRVQVAGIILVIGSGVGAAIGIALAVIVSRRLIGAFARGQHAAAAAREAAHTRKELLDMASHDLRSPLHSIMLGVEVIRERHGALPQLVALEHAAKRMQKLVEGLLDASRAETTGLVLQREPTTIDALFQSTTEMFNTRAERAGVRLTVRCALEEPLFVDSERVLQILSNLVSNALSFTPRGGEVALDAAAVATSIRISVSDTGPGIPEQERAYLFDAFSQASEGRLQRSRRGSVGLGLYIAKNLVIAHGGRMGVDSKLGSGSTFWFELPALG